MPIGHTTVEVKIGPVLHAAIVTIRAAETALALLPEWHQSEAAELRKAIKRLKKTLLAEMANSREG